MSKCIFKFNKNTNSKSYISDPLKGEYRFFVDREGSYLTNHESILANPLSWRTLPGIQPLPDVELGSRVELAWRCIKAGMSIWISGQAGSGKSYTVREIVESIRASGGNCMVTGTTSVCVHNLTIDDASTIDSAVSFGFVSDSDDLNTIYRKVFGYKEYVHPLWDEADVIVIDEISMMKPIMLERMDFVLRKRPSRNPTKIFGGVPIIFVGDFLQLPPVNCEQMLFECSTWKEMKLARIVLDCNFRADNEDPLCGILSRMRVGKLTDEDVELIKTREFMPIEDNELEPVQLFSLRKDVFQYNNRKLNELVSETNPIQTYEPKFAIVYKNPAGKGTEADKYARRLIKEAENPMIDTHKKKLLKKFPINIVKLVVGAQVKMRVNMLKDVHGIFNSTPGVVEDITREGVVVRFVLNGRSLLPILIQKMPILTPIGSGVFVAMEQIPLSLSWASTVHMCQSQTLPAIIANCKDFFANGQKYAMFSRVSRLKDLSIRNFNREGVKVSTKALQIEDYTSTNEYKQLKEDEALRKENPDNFEEIKFANIRELSMATKNILGNFKRKREEFISNMDATKKFKEEFDD